MRQNLFFSGCMIFIVSILVGCQSSTITNTEASLNSAQSLRFTGRDSLIARGGGVAMIAKVSGALETTESQGCTSPSIFLSGSGAGHVTHLGKTMVEQTACIDQNGNVTGSFTYEGRSGGHVSGTYEGTLTGNKLTADVTLETASVEAPRESPPEDENWGGGRVIGTLTISHFDYEFVGWLFHHNTGM